MTLDDIIAKAHAREARAARKGGLEPPSYHLGRPPEPWEEAIGDTTQRVARQGRTVLEYAKKMDALGITEGSLAGNVNPIADHVASIGRDKIRLLPGGDPTPGRMAALPRGAKSAPGVALDGKDMSDSVETSASNLSDQDDSVDISEARQRAADAVNEGAGPSDASNIVDETPDGIDLIDDTDIRHAVEDFDSTNWTLEQLEVSCQTLLEECYATDDRRRRLLSAGMLRKLVETYPSALRQRNLEAVVNDGLPSMVKGKLAERVFKLDILLGVLAPAMAESMTQLNVMARLLRLMVFRMDTAIRVIHFRYTMPKKLAQYRHLPPAIATHKRMTVLMQGSALRARWRDVNADERNGNLPPSLLHAYMCIVLALVDKQTCPELYRANRVKMIGSGGLLPLSVHFKAEDRSQRVACRILRELAREPLLIYELLKAGVAEYLSRLLPRLRETCIDKLLEALDALDSLAFSAMRFCFVSSSNADAAQGNSALVAALVAEGPSIGGLEAEIRLPSGNMVEEAVEVQLGLPHLMATLTGLLEETNVQLYLAGVVILGKLANTSCYHGVLQEILAYAGRALERLIQGLQSQELIVPEMSLALMLQLCSRQEGRDGIEATDGAAMIQTLVAGRYAQESPRFLRGLACAVALARRGPPGPAPGAARKDDRSPPRASGRLRLPRAGGVGRSGPPRPHLLDLEGKLYRDIVNMLDAPPPAPAGAVQGLIRMGFLGAVMRFLVRDDKKGSNDDLGVQQSGGGGVAWTDGRKAEHSRLGIRRRSSRSPHYFSLKQRYACLGAIALHGLAILAGPRPAIFTRTTLQYLCYSIQVAYVDLTVGRLAPGVDYPLVFRSIQLACRALAFLATSNAGDASHEEGGQRIEADRQVEPGHKGVRVDHGPLRRVADMLISTTAIKEVACIAQMPSRAAWTGDDAGIYRHLERTVTSAAILIACVCPVPAGERDPFSRFDEPQDEKSSLQHCQALMEHLVKVVGGALCSTLMVADDLEIISYTCRALAKLSDTNVTTQMLLDSYDMMKAIIRLGPKSPIVLPDGISHAQGACGKALPTSHRIGVRRQRAPVTGQCPTDQQCTTSPVAHGGISRASVMSTRGCRADPSGQCSSRCKCSVRDLEAPSTRCKKDESGQETRVLAPDQACAKVVEGQNDVPKREAEDGPRRKLISLPFDYFRLVANIARVPSGRALLQSSGILKRCLERLAVQTADSPAAQRATLRCRSEIFVLLARMAGTYDRDTGSANYFILSPRYQALQVMLEVLSISSDHAGLIGASEFVVQVARHNAAYALAELCQDALKTVPLVARAGGLSRAAAIAKDPASPMPLIKHVLRSIQAAASFPDGVHIGPLAESGLLRALHRITNTAYPGYRPSQPAAPGKSSSSCPDGGLPTPSSPKRREHTATTPSLYQTFSSRTAFGPTKPTSAEAQLIAELGREVAYLLGPAQSKSLRVSGMEPPSPCVPDDRASSPSLGIAPYGPASEGGIAFGRAGGEPDCASQPPCIVADSRETALLRDRSRRLDGKDAGAAKAILPGHGRHDLTNVTSSRLGTYLHCGVTTCAGLGASGRHGDIKGNVPHPAFILKTHDQEEGRGLDSKDHVHSDVIVRSPTVEPEILHPIANLNAEETGDTTTGLAKRSCASDVVTTPLAMLSAREACFRRELIRRKEHYGLGGTGQFHVKCATYVEPPAGAAAPCKNKRQCTALSGSGDPIGVIEGTRRRPPGRSCAAVDVVDIAALAATRPAGDPPRVSDQPPIGPGKSATGYIRDGEVDEPVIEAPNEQEQAARVSGSPCEQEFVTFARPAAHWWVTRTAGGTRGKGSDPHPRGGVHVPELCGGSVVGRFACRGYLLDPTFAEHNPIILHPRLPAISGWAGLRQVPEDSTLAGLVASRAAKGAKAGSQGGVEPYRHASEVLCHRVDVVGERRAGQKRFFDEHGRPSSPIKFHHAFEYVDSRKGEYEGVLLNPAPKRF